VNPPEPEEIIRTIDSTARLIDGHGQALGKLVGQWLDTDPSSEDVLKRLQRIRNGRAATNTVLGILADHYANALGIDWRQLRHQLDIPMPVGRYDGADPGPAPTIH
jgi:hypothetical protein